MSNFCIRIGLDKIYDVPNSINFDINLCGIMHFSATMIAVEIRLDIT